MNQINDKLSGIKIISFYGDSLTRGFPGASYFEILKKQLLKYELINCGKGGDTVLSLYRRVKNLQLDKTSDLAFLWVGTNDVFAKISGSYPMFKTFVNQPWSRNPEEFERYFRLTLDLLCQRTNKVITVPPLFMGEDVNSGWHQEFGELSSIIEGVSASYVEVKYLNLREIILPKLNGKKLSRYLPTSLTRIALDTLLLKQKEQIDKKSFERGLFFTLDGVHLNSNGAEIVAEIFLETIKDLEER